jgi:ABC-type spermidine/putrescine transport system permease subunit I
MTSTTGRASQGRRWLSRAETTALLTPGGLLLLLLALAPFVLLVVTGFRTDEPGFTLDNFRRAFDATYVDLAIRTLKVALIATVLAIALGWPAGWAIARAVAPRYRSMILSLVILPYLSSQLLLIYAFMSVIQPGGPLMTALNGVGLFSSDSSILYTPNATLAMLVYENIPLVVLVMYTAAEQLDGRLLEAARSMGAGTWRTFATVVWPLSAGQLLAAFALTFVQSVGAFAESAVLGGPNGQLLGNVIGSQLSSGVNRSFAIAMAVTLLVVSLVVVGFVALLVIASTRRLGTWPAPSQASSHPVRSAISEPVADEARHGKQRVR